MKQLWEFRCCKHCNMKQMGQMSADDSGCCVLQVARIDLIWSTSFSYLLSDSAEGQVTLPVCSTLNNQHFNKVTFTTVLPFCSDTSLPVLLSSIVTLFCTDLLPPPSLTLDSRYPPNTHAHIWSKLDYTTLLGGRLREH